MTGNDESRKNKKFAVGGGDLPPSPTTSTGTTTTTATTNKRPTRHHVKRRSSGRVHVSKLAPMARAHSNSNNEDVDEVRKPMKRSQSNKSLTKLTSTKNNNLPVFTPATTNNEEVEQEEKVISPPTTPPPNNNNNLIEKQKPTFHVSHTIPAAPIEQTLSVTADDLVAPEITNTIKQQLKKPLLKSQFVEKKKSNVASAANAQPTGMTRTQQKILLQREQSLVHDENNIAHPKNMIRLTREMEKMGKEYRCVRKYQDPMMDSLKRCCQQKSKPVLQARAFSTAQLPILPHMEHRRQILLKTALQHQQHKLHDEEDNNNNKSWSATQFLDRLFFGTS